jgi:hypothetical protein
MPITRPFLLYLRSRLHLGVSVAAGCLLVLDVGFLRPHAFLPAVLIVVGYAAVTGLLFFSRAGAREVVAESDEDSAARTKAKIDAVAAIRERISVLRIGDEKVALAIELFLQESGAYLDECRRLSTYSPLANDRVDRVLEICQVFLGERDQSATARRYESGAEDSASAQPSAEPADTAESLAKDIRDCAAFVRARITVDLLGTSGSDRLAIMKELEEKK